jgi:4-hydroxybenzoate polyprenyltransferase
MTIPSARDLAVLLRVSNLPTVWTNALCGWWLAGGGAVAPLAWVLLGLSLVYSAGMVLNDAWDAPLDRVERPGRPVAAGRISRRFAFALGFAGLVCGVIAAAVASAIAGVFAFGLAMAVLLYEEIHKTSPRWGAVVMGFCRTLAVVVGGAAAVNQGGIATWIAAAAVGLFVVGVTVAARDEASPVPARLRLPARMLFAVPVAAAALLIWGHAPDTASSGWALWVPASTLLPVVLWLARTLPLLGRDRMRAVGDLLSGICLIDLALAVYAPPAMAAGFLVAFAACLLMRRFVPAT